MIDVLIWNCRSHHFKREGNFVHWTRVDELLFCVFYWLISNIDDGNDDQIMMMLESGSEKMGKAPKALL